MKLLIFLLVVSFITFVNAYCTNEFVNITCKDLNISLYDSYIVNNTVYSKNLNVTMGEYKNIIGKFVRPTAIFCNHTINIESCKTGIDITIFIIFIIYYIYIIMVFATSQDGSSIINLRRF